MRYYSISGLEEGVCSVCGEECEGYFVDESFDHAFGTEYCGHFLSPCCDADIVNEDEYEGETES